MDKPSLGSAAKIYGKACPNEKCARYQGLVIVDPHCEACHWCQLCGEKLRAAMASVAVFEWIKT